MTRAMPYYSRPTNVDIQAFRDQQAKLSLTYDCVGASAVAPPSGYVTDHTRVQLGTGDDVFVSAKLALQRWLQLRLPWTEVYPANSKICLEEVVVIVARSLGLWWLNACRIVYLIDRPDQNRFGFAYGTLPGHAGRGEERFLVEMDRSNRVWYDLFAFSRPNGLLSKFGYPYLRHRQRLFGRQSAATMQRLVRRDHSFSERQADLLTAVDD